MARVKKVKSEFEGRVFEESIVVEGEGLTPWDPGTDLKYVGKRMSRVDGTERVSGKAQYTADVQLPGMLYGKILRSPHAHARIKKIDTRRAEKVPGVRAVLTFQKIPQIPFWAGLSFILDSTVRFIGDEVACVIAEEEEICSDALEEVSVEYEPLPFVWDPEEALKADAPKVHPQGNLYRGGPDVYQRGNLEQGLAEAEVIVEDTFRTQTALHNSMEVHGSVAQWEGDQLVIWDSTQNIFGVRAQAA